MLQNINTSLAQGRLESALTDAEREQIITKIADTVEDQLNSKLLSNIERTYGRHIRNERLSEIADAAADSTVKRLTQSVLELHRKANVNLIYGSGSAILGIAVLAFLVYTVKIPEGASNIGQVFYYSGRIGLVLLIETLAFFFLRLYRSTLYDVKYMNNEITNVEARYGALTVALKWGNSEAVQNVLSHLSRTERNFALKKGETSVFDSADRENDSSYAVLGKLVDKIPQRSGAKE